MTKRAMLLAAAAVTMGGALVVLRLRQWRAPDTARPATLALVEFGGHDRFRDSLAARLARAHGLAAPPRGVEAGYELGGTMSVADGRLTIAARLTRSGENRPAWTATFWRSATAEFAIVDELAAAIAEALHADRQAESAAATHQRPAEVPRQ